MTSSNVSSSTGFTNTPAYQVIRWICAGYIVIGVITYIAALPSRYTFLIDVLGQPPHLALLQVIPEAILVAVTAVVSAFLYSKSTRDRMVLLTSVSAVIGTANLPGLAAYAPLTNPIFWLPSAMVFLGTAVITHLWYVTFPDGRTVPMWARLWAIVIIVWEIFRYYFFFVVAGPDEIAVRPFAAMITAGLQLPSFLMLAYRFRNTTSLTRRQQFKWIAVGLATAPPLVLMFFLRGIVRLQDNTSLTITVEFLAAITVAAGSIFFCLALMFAVLRRGLWEVDATLNRSLVTGAATIVLALLFVAIFLVLQGALRSLRGEWSGEIAAAVAALVIGGLFNPVRHRVRHFIDRRVYGLRYDLDQIAAAYSDPPTIENPGVLSGRIIGGFELMGVLGRGGMGEVYKGCAPDGRLAAVKILRESLVDDEQSRQRFVREGEITVRHPNIVATYGYGRSTDLYYIALQYVEGETLRAVLKRRERLSLDEVESFLPELASAIDTIHAQGYVHRDITAGNIMIRGNDEGGYDAMLMDFGIAKVMDSKTSLTGVGSLGTMDYMAPEQILQAQMVDQRADIYALGVVLFEALTGERPFVGSVGQVLFSHLYQPAPDPRERVPELPERVTSALLKALAKDPIDRYPNALEFTQALLD